MSSEEWKGTGNCRNCRRAAYCHKRCGANKRRIRTITELSLLGAAGKKQLQNAARHAHDAKERLAKLREKNGEDVSEDAVDTMFERCKKLAMGSKYSVAQIVGGIEGMVCITGDSTEDVLRKIEEEYRSASADGY